MAMNVVGHIYCGLRDQRVLCYSHQHKMNQGYKLLSAEELAVSSLNQSKLKILA